MLAGQNQGPSPERNGGFVPEGLRASGDTGCLPRGIPAPAGNPHGGRPRTASLRRNAVHDPPVLSGESDLPMNDLEECHLPCPARERRGRIHSEGNFRLRLETSSGRFRKARRFGGPRHRRLQIVRRKIFSYRKEQRPSSFQHFPGLRFRVTVSQQWTNPRPAIPPAPNARRMP